MLEALPSGLVLCVGKDEVACVLFEEETLFHTQGVGWEGENEDQETGTKDHDIDITFTPSPVVPERHPIRPARSISCRSPSGVISRTHLPAGMNLVTWSEAHTLTSPRRTTTEQE